MCGLHVFNYDLYNIEEGMRKGHGSENVNVFFIKLCRYQMNSIKTSKTMKSEKGGE